MRLRRRPPAVARSLGERPLAWAASPEGTLLVGTRDALHLLGGQQLRIPWERIETADWARDTETFEVVEVGEFGDPRPVHTFTLDDPRRLLQLVRERVTASVVLQRWVAVSKRSGFRVIARRSPAGGGVGWFVEYDRDVDPDDPQVSALVSAALREAQAEVD